MSHDTPERRISRWLAGAPAPSPAELANDEALLRAVLAALDTLDAWAPADPDGALDLLEGLAEDALALMPPAQRPATAALGPRAAALLAPFVAASPAAERGADPRAAGLLRGALPDLTAADGPWVAHALETMAGLIDELALDDAAALDAEARWLDPLHDARDALAAEPVGPIAAAGVRIGPPLQAQAREAGAEPAEIEPAEGSAPSTRAIPGDIAPELPAVHDAVPPRPGRPLIWALGLAAVVVIGVALLQTAPPERPPEPQPVATESRHDQPERTAPAPRAGQPATAHRPALVPIPAGTSRLGSPPDEPGRQPDETLRDVTLTRPYWMGRTEVTQAQWIALMGNRPAQFHGLLGGGPLHPIEQVSWYDAVAYANALSAVEGLPACYVMRDCAGVPGDRAFTCAQVTFEGLDCAGYRLPTEAEWEHAARAGTRTATYAGPMTLRGERDAPVLEDIAWYSGNSGVPVGGIDCGDWTGRPPGVDASGCGTHPVASKRPNPWGLYDMLGNVWEWTHDGHGELSSAPAVDPVVPPGRRMVTKGCGWFREARFCRAANRYRPKPDYRTWVLGIRVVRTIDR